VLISNTLKRYAREPADPAEIDGFRLGPWSLPEAARSFYATTNGLLVPELGTEILSLAAAKEYGDALDYHPDAQIFGLLPFTESNDSNPYCLILRERLHGAILQLHHDFGPKVTHSSLKGFLAALAELVEAGGELIDDLPHEEITDSRLVTDSDILISETLQQAKPNYSTLISLLSACSPQSLITLLKVDDMWVREAAAERCGRLGLLEAQQALQELAASGSAQDCHAAEASLLLINRKLFDNDA
jgi:hypothetical protein